MDDLLYGLPEVLCHVDDILIYGTQRRSKSHRFHATLERIQTASITLNEGINVILCYISRHRGTMASLLKIKTLEEIAVQIGIVIFSIFYASSRLFFNSSNYKKSCSFCMGVTSQTPEILLYIKAIKQ